jgi:glucose/arabinose dehydrogenase
MVGKEGKMRDKANTFSARVYLLLFGVFAILNLSLHRTALGQCETPLQAKRLFTGMTRPVWVGAPAGDSRIFIVQQYPAKIIIRTPGSGTVKTFLDIDSQVLGAGGSGFDGLLSMAFHPDYANNGYFYVFYDDLNLRAVVARFQVTADPDVADPNSEQIIITFPKPNKGHNGGMIAFCPDDGYLYLGVGEDDQSVFAQDTSTLLGKFLRIDVNGDDFPGDPDRNYAVPTTNPFFGPGDPLDEIWTIGLRNPWRWSFDPLTKDIYIGHVGDSKREEIEFIPAGVGGLNLGWNCVEGTFCHNRAGCPPCTDPGFTPPIYEYAHVSGTGASVIGGVVYRGSAIPDLQGTYFFSDYNEDKIWSFRYDGSNLTAFQERTELAISEQGDAVSKISAFGYDGAGEILICQRLNPRIYKIVPIIDPELTDCNGNGQPDECDIQLGSSKDCDGNGVPDDCTTEADADCDGDVDGLDFAKFSSCYNGAGNPPRTSGCDPTYVGIFDYDEDGDIDGSDFSNFASCFNRAGYTARPPCNVGPQVTLDDPSDGETVVANQATSVQWTAGDDFAIDSISLYFSEDGGTNYTPIALNLVNSGTYTWFPPNRPTDLGIIRVVALDIEGNASSDENLTGFTVNSPPGGILATTLRDFDMPGSQPFDVSDINAPQECVTCHGNYDAGVEPYFMWQGSMMAHASIDPLFGACLAIANQDAPDSGDLCLRCHDSRGWLAGRSVPTDGSQMLTSDKIGVSCDLCHRLVDPVFTPLVSPAEDNAILAAIIPPSAIGNGQYVVDPDNQRRRGPYSDAAAAHPFLVSPYHQEAALCGTCHNVSNPAFVNDGLGNFIPGALDTPAADLSPHAVMPIERTYSEWLHSEYNSANGVFAPQFGGNKDYVSTCQDCHMRDVTGRGCNLSGVPIRSDLPLHDLTGGSTWIPSLLPALYPGQVDPLAIQAGIDRARQMLQNAAVLTAQPNGSQLDVTVTNNTGHKLPTGYPEGRRMWLNVKFLDAGAALLSESGAYDSSTGILTLDAEIKVYEVHLGVDATMAPVLSVPEGETFHFVLNNKVFKDNRIPPRGFTNVAYESFGGKPVGHTYADGQYWDVSAYVIPANTTSAEVTLYYQSTSKEYIEFLRDENTTNSAGQTMYDLWNDNGKCPPEVMAQITIPLSP